MKCSKKNEDEPLKRCCGRQSEKHGVCFVVSREHREKFLKVVTQQFQGGFFRQNLAIFMRLVLELLDRPLLDLTHSSTVRYLNMVFFFFFFFCGENGIWWCM